MSDPNPPSARRPVVWAISGTDSGGGAGVQADTRALDAFDVHPACAVAAITAQHSRAVRHVEPVAAATLDAQLQALAEDMPPAAIKTGMLGTVANLRVVAGWVRRLRQEGRGVALVVDPVWGSSTGTVFADEALREAYRHELLPLATLATPNLAEARALARPDLADAPALARAWRDFGARAVVVTGGDVQAATATDPESLTASDWLDSGHGLPARGWLELPRIDTPHQHGTGCVFASAAAAALAHGFVAADAAVLAKMATTEALRHGYGAGSGAGPVSPRRGFARRPGNLPTFSPEAAPHAAGSFAPLPPETLGLYAIVDSAEAAAQAVRAGVRLVQLRIKRAPSPDLAQEIRRALAHASNAGARLIVNDHWQLALELGAHGVHLGQEDLEGVDFDALRRAGLLLGISTHAYWEVCRARALAPSYIACGPIHATQLKRMPWTPQGNGNLAYWCAMLGPTPVVAIGGMDVARAREATHAGAASVAVVGAISRTEDPDAAIRLLQESIEPGRRMTAAVPDWARPTLSAPAC